MMLQGVAYMLLKKRKEGPPLRLKRLNLSGYKKGDLVLSALVWGWQQGSCFDALEEVVLADSDVTDEGVGELMASGMLCAPIGQQDKENEKEEKEEGSGQDEDGQARVKKPPVPLRRLVLNNNRIQGGDELAAQLRQVSSAARSSLWSSSLLHLEAANNPWVRGGRGLPALLACAGPSLQYLKLGPPASTVAADNALARAIFGDAAILATSARTGGASLGELRSLDMGGDESLPGRGYRAAEEADRRPDASAPGPAQVGRGHAAGHPGRLGGGDDEDTGSVGVGMRKESDRK